MSFTEPTSVPEPENPHTDAQEPLGDDVTDELITHEDTADASEAEGADIPVAEVEVLEVGVLEADAEVTDASPGTVEAEVAVVDDQVAETAAADAAVVDAGVVDAGVIDADVVDTAVADADVVDAGVVDVADADETDDDEDDDGFESDDDEAVGAAAVLYDDQVKPQFGFLGFTLRELIIGGAWLVAFVVSFFPLTPAAPVTIWTSGISWVLTIGVPTAAVFLLVLRRLSPEGIRRVGSLGIDQFASVAASVAAVAWAQLLWSQATVSIQTGMFLVGWPVIVAMVATLVLVAVTTAAVLIPSLREDFEGRRETLAHRNANPVRPVVARPRPVAVAPAAPASVETDASELPDDLPTATPVAETSDAEEQPYDPDETHVIPRLDPSAFPAVVAAQNAAPDAGAAAEQVEDLTDGAPSEIAAPPVVAFAPAEEIATPGEADAALSLEDSAPVEIYKTGAVDVLQEIFAADGVTSPIAMLSTDTGTIQPLRPDHRDATEDSTPVQSNVEQADSGDQADSGEQAEKPALRRDRAEQTRQRNAQEPFWILAKTERDVLDELGHPLFRIGPSDWTLVLEDRGGAFVVRHEDGRIGYLHDMSDITKG